MWDTNHQLLPPQEWCQYLSRVQSIWVKIIAEASLCQFFCQYCKPHILLWQPSWICFATCFLRRVSTDHWFCWVMANRSQEQVLAHKWNASDHGSIIRTRIYHKWKRPFGYGWHRATASPLCQSNSHCPFKSAGFQQPFYRKVLLCVKNGISSWWWTVWQCRSLKTERQR